MNDKYKFLLKDTFIFALGNFGSKIILFLLVPLYTNYLTTSEYGTADLITTFSQLIIPIASLCINESIVRFALKKDEKPENVIIIGFSIFIFSLFVVLISLPALNLYKLIAPWKWYLAIYIILSCISETEKAYLKAKGFNKKYALISILETLILAITNFILIKVLKKGVSGYLIANNVALAATVIFSFFAGKIYRSFSVGKFDISLLKRMVTFSYPLIFNNISWWVIHSSDKIMIEAMIGASALGLYTAATKVPSLINVIIAIFTQAWSISSIKEIENDADNTFFSNVFEAYSLVCFGAAIFFTSIVKIFMKVYVGDSFFGAWKYTPLLLSAAVFYAISSYYGSLYSAIQKTLHSMTTTIICAITNIVVNYIFIRIVDTWGAIIGTVFSYFVISHLRMIDIRKYVEIKFNKLIYCLNCMLLLAQAILVSLDFEVYIVSITTMIFFILLNIEEIKRLLDGVWLKL